MTRSLGSVGGCENWTFVPYAAKRHTPAADAARARPPAPARRRSEFVVSATKVQCLTFLPATYRAAARVGATPRRRADGGRRTADAPEAPRR